MKKWFNGDSQRLGAAKKAALKAIAAHDTDGLRKALEPLPETALSKEDKSDLIAAAIDATDLETYKAVAMLAGGPNASVCTRGFEKHVCLNAFNQLHYALFTPGAEQIATFIAGHPDYDGAYYMISEARKQEAGEVTALLARKLVPVYRESLAQLESEAADPKAPAAKKSGLNL